MFLIVRLLRLSNGSINANSYDHDATSKEYITHLCIAYSLSQNMRGAKALGKRISALPPAGSAPVAGFGHSYAAPDMHVAALAAAAAQAHMQGYAGRSGVAPMEM